MVWRYPIFGSCLSILTPQRLHMFIFCKVPFHCMFLLWSKLDVLHGQQCWYAHPSIQAKERHSWHHFFILCFFFFILCFLENWLQPKSLQKLFLWILWSLFYNQKQVKPREVKQLCKVTQLPRKGESPHRKPGSLLPRTQWLRHLLCSHKEGSKCKKIISRWGFVCFHGWAWIFPNFSLGIQFKICILSWFMMNFSRRHVVLPLSAFLSQNGDWSSIPWPVTDSSGCAGLLQPVPRWLGPIAFPPHPLGLLFFPAH